MLLKKYLTFDELLQRWNREKNEIHYLISDSKLVPSIAWDGYAISCSLKMDPENEGSYLIEFKTNEEQNNFVKVGLSGWIYLRRPMPLGPNKYSFSYATIQDLSKHENLIESSWYRLIDDPQYNTVVSVDDGQIESDAVFMMDEIESCEKFHPELLAIKQHSNIDAETEASAERQLIAQSFDKYPNELKAAIKVWHATFEVEGKGKSKEKIMTWLRKHENEFNPKLSETAKERITTVANWDKTAGPTKT